MVTMVISLVTINVIGQQNLIRLIKSKNTRHTCTYKNEKKKFFFILIRYVHVFEY